MQLFTLPTQEVPKDMPSCWRRKLDFRYTLLQKRRSRSFLKQRSFIWVGSWLVRSRAMLRLQNAIGYVLSAELAWDRPGRK